MKVIEITESKFDHLLENTQKMLRYGGEIMTCLSDLERENGISERTDMRHMGMRGDMNYRYPMGERNYMNEYDDDEMNERRYRDSRGRYASR